MIYGSCESTADNKNRIIVPAFTSVEQNDELLISDEEKDCLIISNSEERTQRIRILLEEIASETDIKKIHKLQSLIDALSGPILGKASVDSQHRILLTEEALKHLGVEPKNRGSINFYFRGFGNRLKLYPSKEIFEKTQKEKVK